MKPCLWPEGHSDRHRHLNNLAISLWSRFNHQGKPNDLDDAISLHEEALRLRLRLVERKLCYFSLGNLGNALITRFNKHGDIDDIT
jgi:hypothetical protein